MFEPLAAEEPHTDRVIRYEAPFRTMMAALLDAVKEFAALDRDFPDDPCIAFHRQRLAAGEQGGVIVMTEK